MKCSLSTVYRLLDHIEETGRLEAIYLYHGVVKFDKAETCVLLNIARANRFQSRRFIAQRYQALRGITISLTSVTRILAKYSLSYYIAKCKPLLTDIHKKARMDFSRMNYHQPLEYWRTFMYTDECCSRCYQNRQQKVLRTKEQEWDPSLFVRSVKSGKFSAMVWGAITYGHKSRLWIMPCGTTMTSIVYSQVIDEVALPFLKKYELKFQQDNAPIHTSKYMRAYFAENNITLYPFPVMSPNLNHIKHYWNLLKANIFPEGCTSWNEFVDQVKRAWHDIPHEIINNLIDSMPRRLEAVIMQNGDATKY
ncbi:DDE_superfamily endonuclease domain-containing protein [Hexamita inflata]|uniref:DDE superfamily endonuclease domain-containing protein n=1 Tax=Hexamita inflata TaxID=28002 RepID=A0AA86QD27_9EUKA|nr:DDE superfamily endonuclease domain-containing protein [Hexamita inflata]